MPKLSQKLPSNRRHSNGKQAIVVLSGETHYLGLYGSRASKREYDRLVGEWMRRGRKSEPVSTVQESVSMAELMAGYLRHAKSYYVKKGKTEAPEPKRIMPVADEIVDATLPHLSPIVATSEHCHGRFLASVDVIAPRSLGKENEM